jgi:hypothetical protein
MVDHTSFNANKPVEKSTAGLFSFNKYPHGNRHPLMNPYLLTDHEAANKYTTRAVGETEEKK